jgi:tetratricopeptide (TPR) repeat protein
LMTAEPRSDTRSAADAAVREVFEAARAGDLGRAKALAVAALAAGHEHPVLLNLRALDHEENGRLEAALSDLRRAHALAPDDFSILNACGLALARLRQFEAALGCYEKALALRPDFAPAWFNSGSALEQLGESARAADAYARCGELDPRNAQAWANAAWLAARRGDKAATRACAEKAMAIQPEHPTAVLALASIELAEPATAERRLRALLSRPELGAYDRAVALGQLGDALDGLGRPAEAFAAYRDGNAIFQAEAQDQFEAPGQTTIPQLLAWLVPWAEQLDAKSWTRGGGAGGKRAAERQHVFLLGFPRSGTTLIESVLAGHPSVTTLEERDTLGSAVRAYMDAPEGLKRLAAADGRELGAFRDDYWARVRGFGIEPKGAIFIDKNPFNTLKLPLIYKLFPDAKLIFALRDPRDVVLSCFRRRFNLNPSTYELLDLTCAAAFYDQTMRFWEAIRQKQELDERGLVYESLVADFEAEARATCEFIGADWRPELADFAGRAQRGGVASASSEQIARGLFSEGAGQWRRYRAELAPILPILAPWVARFGYPAT